MTTDVLKEIVVNESDDLIRYWLEKFPEEEKAEEARYYEDFLSFFEECVDKDLDLNSVEADALKAFLEKIIEILGEDKFFNFKNAVYTCYLKFPIMRKLEEKNALDLETVKKITIFFESITSSIIVGLLKKTEEVTMSAINELEEREAPIAEIWKGVVMLSIVGSLDSNRVIKIIDKILLKLEDRTIEHVIVDIGSIYDMNSEVARQIIKLNNAIHFMGTNAYLTGITPAIAKSLTHLDIKLGDIRTFSTTQKAMEYILNGKI